MSDFSITNHGSILLLLPLTDAGNAWADEHLPDNAQMFGKSIVVEPRYIADIVDGIQADGLTVD